MVLISFHRNKNKANKLLPFIFVGPLLVPYHLISEKGDVLIMSTFVSLCVDAHTKHMYRDLIALLIIDSPLII